MGEQQTTPASILVDWAGVPRWRQWVGAQVQTWAVVRLARWLGAKVEVIHG